MNPEVALPEEVVELCGTAIDTFVDVLRRQEAVNESERQRTLGAAIVACDALAGYRKNGWHRVLRQECASRGVRLRRFTPYEKQRELDRAYSSLPTSRSFENTTPNAIGVLLEPISEESP